MATVNALTEIGRVILAVVEKVGAVEVRTPAPWRQARTPGRKGIGKLRQLSKTRPGDLNRLTPAGRQRVDSIAKSVDDAGAVAWLANLLGLPNNTSVSHYTHTHGATYRVGVSDREGCILVSYKSIMGNAHSPVAVAATSDGCEVHSTTSGDIDLHPGCRAVVGI